MASALSLARLPGPFGVPLVHRNRPSADVLRSLREKGSTVPLATCEVEDTFALDQGPSEEVPVIVLIDDLEVPGPRYAALAGPLDEAIGSTIRLIGLHVRNLQDPER